MGWWLLCIGGRGSVFCLLSKQLWLQAHAFHVAIYITIISNQCMFVCVHVYHLSPLLLHLCPHPANLLAWGGGGACSSTVEQACCKACLLSVSPAASAAVLVVVLCSHVSVCCWRGCGGVGGCASLASGAAKHHIALRVCCGGWHSLCVLLCVPRHVCSDCSLQAHPRSVCISSSVCASVQSSTTLGVVLQLWVRVCVCFIYHVVCMTHTLKMYSKVGSQRAHVVHT